MVCLFAFWAIGKARNDKGFHDKEVRVENLFGRDKNYVLELFYWDWTLWSVDTFEISQFNYDLDCGNLYNVYINSAFLADSLISKAFWIRICEPKGLAIVHYVRCCVVFLGRGILLVLVWDVWSREDWMVTTCILFF